MGKEFFDHPAAFGWVIEKGQVPCIYFMQSGVWHQLHCEARNTSSAEWAALTPQKPHGSPLGEQLLCREFIFRPRAVRRSDGGDRSESI
jgi:hypothetical protein